MLEKKERLTPKLEHKLSGQYFEDKIIRGAR
jgi:hypothetical protein